MAVQPVPSFYSPFLDTSMRQDRVSLIFAPALSSASIFFSVSKAAVYGTNVCPTFSGDVAKTNGNETKNECANNRFGACGSILETNDVILSTKSCCIRLAKLIALSPGIALLFKSLEIGAASHDPIDYQPFAVIESLVNLKHLTLSGGLWSRIPDTVVSGLQSHSYRSLRVCQSFDFRAIGEICSLLQNSPDLQWASFWFKGNFTEECHLDHSLHRIPAPVMLHIGEADPTFPIETLLKLAASFRSCPFSFRNIHTLNIILSSRNAMLRQHLNQYLVLVGTSLNLLHVNHSMPVPMYTSSETLDVSNVEKLSVRILKCDTNYFGRGSQIFEWWISNLSVVKERSAIHSITFNIMSPTPEREMHVTLDWDDLWTRLDECLASYKMASLEHFALTFLPQPAKWDTYKTHIEGKFPLLKQLGREVVLNATKY
ncbi:uncharacterized protein ARMOST_10411 [Armillaria ostoyae]|uniref:F-box domain-containing protein n=1 Tax=Armillaria ostoyae TaxID=47428 RepID=A0A284REB1_ARMOS|nr:uncharacterized protein ARMOST_10411 [Armillaria ostoyae]